MKTPLRLSRVASEVPGEIPGGEHHLPKDLAELAHLLFEWPIRQSPRLALPCFILVAAMVQAGIMILFSISYTTPSQIAPFSPQIYFVTPNSPAARQLAPWLEANDPAVFSPQYAAREALPAPPPLKYRPSYEDSPPPLRPMPEEETQTLEPPMIPLMTGIQRRRAVAFTKPLAAPSSVVTPTVVQWQDQLAGRSLLPSSAKIPPPQPPNAVSGPGLYEVEISPEGLPLHCVLLDSSGDSESDEAGGVWIHSARFQPAEKSSWGRVLMLWVSPPHTDPTKTTPGVTP